MAKKRTYQKKPCPICAKDVSVSGVTWTKHMREHVEDGVADEIQWQKTERWRDKSGQLQTNDIDKDYEYTPGTGQTIERRRHVQP